MELRDLTADEDIVLLGFLDEIISADGEYSDSEKAKFAALEAVIGKERVEKAIAEVNRRFPTRQLLEEAAKTLSRPEARHAILDFLEGMAESDQVTDREDDALGWLASTWSIAR
jgi:hypothetical protein